MTNLFGKIKDFLDGKKTYLSATGGVLVFAAFAFGFITLDQAIALAGFFGFTGLATLRAAVGK